MSDLHNSVEDGESDLILAAEDCPPEQFSRFHNFSQYEDKIIKKLMAHGPVLIRGGRGSGKSALMIEAYNRLKRVPTAFGVYVSLRHMPLLRSQGEVYKGIFCRLLSQKVIDEIAEQKIKFDFPICENEAELQVAFSSLAQLIKKRVVLLFDDPAHIGREAPLEEFFDTFRTISSSSISCKASIYPGVTKFGIRFDVFNDATVIDINRSELSADFGEFFHNVISARYPDLNRKLRNSSAVEPVQFSRFLGRAVVGNMRAFIVACNWFYDRERIGLNELGSCLNHLSGNYYWPLMDEVEPKLGVYEGFVATAREIADKVFEFCGSKRDASAVLIHRNIIQEFSKVFEILEYLGFFAKREASRSLKSGGRGAVYAVNLCNLLEKTSGKRLTSDLLTSWVAGGSEPAEVHVTSPLFSGIEKPEIRRDDDLAIFAKPISDLRKSTAYPYGLTDDKISRLQGAGLNTVGKLVDASDEAIRSIQGIGQANLKRIRNVIFEAVWM